MKNSVERNHVNREIEILGQKIQLYRCYEKTFCEEKFTGEEKFTLGKFTAVNMNNFGRCNVSKHRVINGSDKYVTLDILLEWDSLYKMRTTSSDSEFYLGRSGKGLTTSLGIKTKTRPKKCKKERYAIRNFSKKDLSNIIGEFENVLLKL